MISIIEGAIAVKACILNKKREVKAIYIDKDKKTRDFNFIRKIAKENNIEVNEEDRSELEKWAIGKTFGGILATVEERKNDEFSDGDIFFIDGVTDPFNLGYIIRTLYAFGFKNIMLPYYHYNDAQLIKSSAGAFEMANIKICNDEFEEIARLKNDGYMVYTMERGDESMDVFEADFSSKALIIIGGEKRGISKLYDSYVNIKVSIPYGSEFRNSLSAASAADVIATLLYRQRHYED